MSERYQNGATIPITVTAIDPSGVKLTGLTDVLLSIRRESDDYYIDFDDGVFKNTGWTTRQLQMSEKNSTYSPGVYFYDWDTDGFADDAYHLESDMTTVGNGPWAEWAYVGDYLSTKDITDAALAMIYEGAESFQDYLRISRSALAGNRSGFKPDGAGVGKFASADGAKDRIISPHDSRGNTRPGGIIVDASD